MSDEDKTAEYDKYKAVQWLETGMREMKRKLTEGQLGGALHPPDALDPRSVAMPVSAFEQRMQRIEKTQEHETSQLTTLFYRLERLDESMRELREWDDEQERKNRWHETYNHSRPSAYRNTSDTEEEYRANVERCHLAAVDAADRAHGPLNQVTLRPGAFDQTAALRGAKLENPPVDEGSFIQSIKFVDSRSMYTMYLRGDVNALVRAAADARAWLNLAPQDIDGRKVVSALEEAIKPFDRSE